MNEPSAYLPTPERIAACAYLIWENEGRPQGHEIEHWAQAEKQLLVDCAHEAAASHSSNRTIFTRLFRRKKSTQREAVAS